ncbi:MAG TPA: N-acetylmuramoyl-L-alanine amidase family protein [Bacillota bacterium]
MIAAPSPQPSGAAVPRARSGAAARAALAALITCMTLALGWLPPAPVEAAGEVALVVNGSPVRVDVPPRILSGRTMVPIRVVSENLGAQVGWDAATRSVTIHRGQRTVLLAVGRTEAMIDQRAVALDVAPVILGGRTLVPLRFVGEALGAQVAWDDATRTVRVSPGSIALTNVTVHPDPDRGRVRLHLSGPAEAQVTALDGTANAPPRVIVDLAETESLLAEPEFPVGLAGVVRGRVEPHPSDPSTTRLILELDQATAYRMTRADNGRDVVLEFPYRITSIRYAYAEDGQAVVIEANGPVQPRASTLADPPRIAVDLPGTTVDPRLPGTLEINEGAIRRVRSAQFDRDTVRTVIDLTAARGYTLRTFHNLAVVYPHRRVTGLDVGTEGGRLRLEIDGDLGLGYRVSADGGGGRVVIPYAVADLPRDQTAFTHPVLGRVQVRDIELEGAPAVEVRFEGGADSGLQVVSRPGTSVVVEMTRPLLAGRTIVIDAGHGGKDPGSISLSGIFEKQLVLQIARLTEKVLTDAGARVIMIRTEDRFIDLYDRAGMANATGADAFVSIHANAYHNQSLHGTETYHYPGSDSGRRLAQLLHREMLAALKQPDRGVRAADFVVLRETRMPAALVEAAYLTHPDGERLLTDPDGQMAVAQAIYRALVAFFQ